MNPPTEIRTRPPVPQIECTILDKIDAPSVFRRRQLVDYSARRAFLRDESDQYQMGHLLQSSSPQERRLACLQQRSSRSNSRDPPMKKQPLSHPEPPAPATTTATADPSVADSSHGDDSEVFFSMKVTKPSRLIRRRPKGKDRCASTTQKLASSASSFFDESITLHSVAPTLLLDDHQGDTTTTALAQHRSISSIPVSELTRVAPAASNSKPMNHASADFSNEACIPNHDSFLQSSFLQQSSSSDFPVMKRAADPRKLRKSMMNWLANRHSTEDLLAPPCDNPVPPLFVKVI